MLLLEEVNVPLEYPAASQSFRAHSACVALFQVHED